MKNSKKATYIETKEALNDFSQLVTNSSTKQEFVQNWQAKLIENGYKCEVLGKQKGFIVLKATKNELSTVYYFDENSYLLVKKESTDQMPEGVIPITDTYSNWKEFGGVKFPTTAQTDTPLYSIKYELDYKTNELIDDSAFAPAK